MNNQRLLIYEYKQLAEILRELNDEVKFEIIDFDKKSSFSELFKNNNYLIITENNQPDFKNQIVIKNIPVRFFSLIEKINTEFLKQKFNQQSNIDVGIYKININSREMFLNLKKLKLTEKEINIILYLYNSKKPVKIQLLQFKVWGYKSELETHTVETHIYRLRKKILNFFKDDKFIISTKYGYQIN